MYSNLRVFDLGDYVKIVSVDLKTSSKVDAFQKIKENKENEKKLENNLVRAKNKINDIALANDFKYFFTLTFNPDYDRYDLYMLLNKFRNHLKVMCNFGYKIKYLIVPEQHIDGAWHFHGFFSDDIKSFLYYNSYGYLSIKNMDSLGFVNIDLIKDKVRVSSYVTKYVVKNMGSGIKKYRNSYFCSTGLKRGEIIYDKIYNSEFFNQHFFSFRNDFCRRKVITKEEFKKIRPIVDKL